jgi:two-component system LytT family response regulator
MNPPSIIRAIIIDDEPYAVEVLQMNLQQHCPKVQVVATTTDSQQGEDLLRKHRPDVLFLDIEMPKLNGFQLLERVDDLFFQIVFTTAYDRYALRAFRFSALDYLLKPIDVYELIRVVERLERMQIPVPSQIELLKEQMQEPTKTPTRIALPNLRGYVFQEVADIMYCESNNTYTYIFLDGKQEPIVISSSLGDLEEVLDNGFFRIHRQYLVNVNKITELLRTDGGMVIMDNGKELPLARNRRQELFELMVKKAI